MPNSINTKKKKKFQWTFVTFFYLFIYFFFHFPLKGEVVRKLKAAGAEKSQITDEVKKLLDAKKALALAKGENPDAKPAGGKDKKKKKGGKK